MGIDTDRPTQYAYMESQLYSSKSDCGTRFGLFRKFLALYKSDLKAHSITNPVHSSIHQPSIK